MDIKHSLGEDNRFSKLFSDKGFAIDKSTDNYKLNNPSKGQRVSA